jgi:hypothetical protein
MRVNAMTRPDRLTPAWHRLRIRIQRHHEIERMAAAVVARRPRAADDIVILRPALPQARQDLVRRILRPPRIVRGIWHRGQLVHDSSIRRGSLPRHLFDARGARKVNITHASRHGHRIR